MNTQTTARKLELVKPQQDKPVKPRTLHDVLSEHKGKPDPHSQWSGRVDGKVQEALSKKGEMDRRMKDALKRHPEATEHQLTALVRSNVRSEVLANDRAYWI